MWDVQRAICKRKFVPDRHMRRCEQLRRDSIVSLNFPMTSYPIANMTKGASWSLCSRSAATVPLQYNLQYLPADCRLRSEQTSRQQLSSAGRRKILLSGEIQRGVGLGQLYPKTSNSRHSLH